MKLSSIPVHNGLCLQDNVLRQSTSRGYAGPRDGIQKCLRLQVGSGRVVTLSNAMPPRQREIKPFQV